MDVVMQLIVYVENHSNPELVTLFSAKKIMITIRNENNDFKYTTCVEVESASSSSLLFFTKHTFNMHSYY